MTKKEMKNLEDKIQSDQLIEQNTFVGNLGEYRFVETADNSQTLWSSFFDETFHNTSGALEETFYTYLYPTQVQRCLNSSSSHPFSILEVGFGMGMGLYALDKFLFRMFEKSEKKEVFLSFTSFEIDLSMLQQVIALKPFSHKLIPNLKEWTFLNNELSIKSELKLNNVNLFFTGKILIGDGREVLQQPSYLNEHKPFHSIFQDPFSPKKNPDLWTVEWFLELKKLSNKDVILSTYSSSTSIRKSLLEALWNVQNQKGFGHKKAMTVAAISSETLGPSDPEVLRKLALSQNFPIYDRDVKSFVQKRNTLYRS